MEQKTTLRFIFTHDEKTKLSDFFEEIELREAIMTFIFKIPQDKIHEIDKDNNIHDKLNDFEDKKFVDVSESNDIELYLKAQENAIRFEETIILKRLNNLGSISLNYPIYINKINNIYIDGLNKDEKTSISLEILYQTIKPELLPEKITYRSKELKCFDTYNNKLRRRISFANIIPDEFDFMRNIKNDYTKFKFENNKTYQILIRIPNKEKAEYSIAENKFNSSKPYNNNKKVNKDNKTTFDKLKEFKKNFNDTFVKKEYAYFHDVESHIKDFKDRYNLEIYIDYYDNFFNYKDFIDIDIEIFILLFYYYEFQIIQKFSKDNKKKQKIPAMLCRLSEFNSDYEKYILEIKKLNIKIDDKLLLIKTYNKKFLDCFRCGSKVEFISVINLNNDKISNPYKKAVNFIKNIIIELKEESRLFEIFLYLDSDIIKNLLIERKKSSEEITDIYGERQSIKYDENPTEYGINMMNLDEVRSHLLKLIPNYIIRIDTPLKFNATYDINTKIMIVNESQLFNTSSTSLNKLFKIENAGDNYVLPITIEILHEMLGHGKKRLLDRITLSPEDYRDSKHNYRRICVKKRIENYKEIIYPESGVVLENYISEDRKIIKWLKTVQPKEQGEKILDVSLWVDKNFNNLEKIVEEYMRNNDAYESKDSGSLYSITINEGDVIDYGEDTCGFHRFDNNNY